MYLVCSVLNYTLKNFENIHWKEIDKNEKIEIKDFKLYGYFSNYYVEYFKTNEGVKKFNSHHFKNKSF